MKGLVLLAGLVLMGAAVCSAQPGTVAGVWQGVWTSPEGECVCGRDDAGGRARLQDVRGDGRRVDPGRIVWRVRKAGPKPPELAGQEGATSTELVKGEMKSDGLLVLNGYDKDGPGSSKALDRYELALADNGKVLGGITWNGGTWTGQLIAMRVKE